MLDKGVTPDGQRLLSEKSVALMTEQSAHSPDVGLLWWRIPAWERYVLKPAAAETLAEHNVASAVRDVLMASHGRTFADKTQLVAFIAEQLGPDWAQLYGSEITGRGLRLSDIYDVDRGPVKAFAANGYLGQYLVIVPGKDLVAVRQIKRRQTHASPGDDHAGFAMEVIGLAEGL